MCAVRMLCDRGSGWQPTRDRPVADAMGVAQGALHCHEIPWRCSFPSNRGVRIRVRGPCHSGFVQLEACACAAACGNDSRGTCLSVGGCVRHRVRRAGGQRGSCAREEHAAEEHAVHVHCAAVRPSRGFARLHDHRGRGQGWCPPHSTAQAAACRFVKESGGGVAGAGCDGAARVADAVPAAPASPWGKCEVGHGCGQQRTRERRWRRGVPSPGC